jgi:hypothetical protein
MLHFKKVGGEWPCSIRAGISRARRRARTSSCARGSARTLPDESGLYADALYLFGFSLGAAPALHNAAEEEVAGVVLGAFAMPGV